MTDLETILSWFRTGDMPTQEEFQETFSSFRHNYTKIPITEVDGLQPSLEGIQEDLSKKVDTPLADGKFYIKRESGVTKTEILADETLESVINRRNYSPKEITFTGDAATTIRDGALGMNTTTYSMYFGNLNSAHTGIYNASFGYGALQNVTTGQGNSMFGHYSGGAIITGQYNTFLGYSAGYDFNNTSKQTTGNVNVGVGNSVMAALTSGYKNIGIGQSALARLTTGAYNVALGQSSMQYLTTHNKSIGVGAQTGAFVQGENNVFIGTGAGRSNTVSTVETVNNRLVIHSSVNLAPNPSIGTENSTDYSASHSNGLILGDFSQRWVKFNGYFVINPGNMPNAQADTAYTKNIVAKADGTFGWEDKVIVPTDRIVPRLKILNFTTDGIYYNCTGFIENCNPSDPFGSNPNPLWEIISLGSGGYPLTAVNVLGNVYDSMTSKSGVCARYFNVFFKIEDQGENASLWNVNKPIHLVFNGYHNSDINNNIVQTVKRVATGTFKN